MKGMCSMVSYVRAARNIANCNWNAFLLQQPIFLNVVERFLRSILKTVAEKQGVLNDK